jgi:glycosyltransferase involved in cell wall biosynthesis
LSARLLSIVLPAYNEEGNIPVLAAELAAVLPALQPLEVECVMVDDGSTDGTRREMLAARERLPALGIRVVALDRNHGLTSAMDAGFRAARGELVATLDTDLQNDPRDLPRLVAAVAEADAAVGVRVHRRDTLVKRLTSKVGNAVRNRLTREDVADTGCSLKVYRREFLQRLKLYDGLHRFLPTLLKMEGARVVQVPVNHRPRASGRSKYGLANRLAGPLADLLAVRWMQRRRLRYDARELP